MTSPQGSSRQAAAELLQRLRDPSCTDDEAKRLRDELVEMHLPLVQHIAKRYAERGEPIEDITQAGTIGLLNAIDRFDPSQGVAFSSYAVPTIVGAIRRHFRDTTWSVKVPRRVQELRGRIDQAHDGLAQELGRSPTVSEIAARADVDPQDVLDSLELSHVRQTQSLTPDDPDGTPLADRLGNADPALLAIEDDQTVTKLLSTLPERERTIVKMRFFQQASQSQIAEQLGISQMHVSRLLVKTLAQLRAELEDSDSPQDPSPTVHS